MPSHLKSTQIVILGDFGADATPTKIKAWIAHAGGTYSTRVTNKTTHLVCSARNWEAKHPSVTNANEKYGEKIAIVNYDWLEDCLMKKRCYHPRKYDWRKKGAKRSRLEERLRDLIEGFGLRAPAARVEVEKKVKISVEQELSKARYSIYEENGKKYDIAITRHVPGKDYQEKYRVRLYVNETTKGRSFATTMTYYILRNNTPFKASNTEYLQGADRGSTWEMAVGMLKCFVPSKTGVFVEELLNGDGAVVRGEWRVRLCGQGGSVAGIMSREGTGAEDQENKDEVRANEEMNVDE